MSTVVKLNVGGTVFHSSKSTLTKNSEFFKTMLETAVPLTRDESGCIFIERDPTHFRLILNFMRDGNVTLPKYHKEIQEIEDEATYYCLDILCALCTNELNKPENIPKADPVLFNVISNDAEELQAVLNSSKPVAVIILLGAGISFFHGESDPTDWKRFLRRNCDEWNIYFKTTPGRDWRLYINQEKPFRCPQSLRSCGSYGGQRTFLEHLEYHMREFKQQNLPKNEEKNDSFDFHKIFQDMCNEYRKFN